MAAAPGGRLAGRDSQAALAEAVGRLTGRWGTSTMKAKSHQVLKRNTSMRTSKTISISLPPAQLRKAEQLARKEDRTMSELVREALRRYEESSASAGAARAAFSLALKAVQEEAARNGANRLSLREINAEIAAVRRERRTKTSATRSA